MGIADLSKQELIKAAGIKTELNNELIEFAYNNLNHLPFGGKRDVNYERMISGMPYNCFEPKLEKVRMGVRDLVGDYTNIKSRDYEDVKDYHQARYQFLKSFIGHVGKDVYMEGPFNFDYGFNTYLGDTFYANFGLTILDVGVVRMGNKVMCATNVTILTATHPVDPTLRRGRLESGLGVTIGDNVWLCSNSTVLPGVTIGEFSVIAAGAVVTKDIPPYSLVAGVPGKVIATLNPFEPDCNVQAILEKHGLG